MLNILAAFGVLLLASFPLIVGYKIIRWVLTIERRIDVVANAINEVARTQMASSPALAISSETSETQMGFVQGTYHEEDGNS